MFQLIAIKKVFKQVILWISLLLPLFFVPAQADTEKGILFQFSKGDGQLHYLLGTMHSSDPRVLKILTQIEPSLQASDQLIMEMVPDMLAMIASAGSMMLPLEQNLKSIIGTDLYAKTLKAAKNSGLNDLALQRLQPWAVAVTLSLPELTGEFLDQRIYAMALEKHKQVQGLETAAEQMAVFEGMAQTAQISMLRDALDNLDQVDAQFEQMVLAYIDRDLNKLTNLSLEFEQSSDKALTDWFMDTLIYQRNLLMSKRLPEKLQQGNALVAVGALHLVGKTGLIAALRQQGYTVTPVY